jgi:hypothetical protein
MPDFPLATAHGPFVELFPDVFVVQSAFTMGPLFSITRNMIVLREHRDLTLVNAVRLSPAGEEALLGLGDVRHQVKIGHFHTRDDAYVRDRFGGTFWAPAPADHTTQRLVEGAPGPHSRARVFVFEHTGAREAALVLDQAEGGLLVTCDSVQHWPDTEGCSFLGGLVTRAMGFLKPPAKIGPIWAKQLTAGKPSVLRPDFDRLLSMGFAHLISGHGALLRDVAAQELTRSVDVTFSGRR